MRDGARSVVVGLVVLGVLAGPAMAQDGAGGFGVWELFRKSFDVFTVLLVGGSIVAVSVIVRNVMEVRESVIAPRGVTGKIESLLDQHRYAEVRALVEKDQGFVSAVVRAAIGQSVRGRAAMREAAEIEAGMQCAAWFRKIEILNVLGNLGPLIGLAGTVWGMIAAFNALGASGGEAGPAQLSIGISKALFHTLLGLMLAIPCLLVFGLYRSRIDRVCNRAMAESARLVERLPAAGAVVPGRGSGGRGLETTPGAGA
jgi:biopolymer transport protein ExbB